MKTDPPLNILLVEDNPLDQEDISRSLRNVEVGRLLGTVDSLDGARERLAGAEPVDIMLLDNMLPDGLGLEFLGEVPGTATIFVTGTGSERVAAEALHHGAYDYIIKDTTREYLALLPQTVRNVASRIRAERDKNRLLRELQDALDHIRTLSGLLPICASCKKIRDDGGSWCHLEKYISQHSEATFTHGICPECAASMMEKLE